MVPWNSKLGFSFAKLMRFYFYAIFKSEEKIQPFNIIYIYLKSYKIDMKVSSFVSNQGAETSCMCVCTKRVCVKFTKPKMCTVGVYST